MEQASLLKAQGVTILTIGVGLSDVTELKSLASHPSYVFTSNNFDQLTSVITHVFDITCEGTFLKLRSDGIS